MSNRFGDVAKNVLVVVLIIGMFLLLAYEQTHYARIGHVVVNHSYGVDYYYDFTDSTGEVYQFSTTEIISPYDTVKVKMFNNCTEEDITDDMVIGYEVFFNSENEK